MLPCSRSSTSDALTHHVLNGLDEPNAAHEAAYIPKLLWGGTRVYPSISFNGRQPTKPLRILVAEDEAMIAMFLADLLGAMGHEVCATVETEAAAVAAATYCLPDFMIVDGNLHEGSGVAAVAEILRTRSVPHIFVTGDVYQLGALPGAIVIQKPFSLHHLQRAIERAMGSIVVP